MLCISSSALRAAPLVIDSKLAIKRAYISKDDIPQFSNRLVFKIAKDNISAVLSDIELEGVTPELVQDVKDLKALDVVILVVPIALRVKDEAHTSFWKRKSEKKVNTFDIKTLSFELFMHGKLVPSICVACSRQKELKGDPCPDYVEGVYECFKTNKFGLDAIETFYFNEKGELTYNAASIYTPEDDSIQSNADTTTSKT